MRKWCETKKSCIGFKIASILIILLLSLLSFYFIFLPLKATTKNPENITITTNDTNTNNTNNTTTTAIYHNNIVVKQNITTTTHTKEDVVVNLNKGAVVTRRYAIFIAGQSNALGTNVGDLLDFGGGVDETSSQIKTVWTNFPVSLQDRYFPWLFYAKESPMTSETTYHSALLRFQQHNKENKNNDYDNVVVLTSIFSKRVADTTTIFKKSSLYFSPSNQTETKITVSVFYFPEKKMLLNCTIEIVEPYHYPTHKNYTNYTSNLQRLQQQQLYHDDDKQKKQPTTTAVIYFEALMALLKHWLREMDTSVTAQQPLPLIESLNNRNNHNHHQNNQSNIGFGFRLAQLLLQDFTTATTINENEKKENDNNNDKNTTTRRKKNDDDEKRERIEIWVLNGAFSGSSLQPNSLGSWQHDFVEADQALNYFQRAQTYFQNAVRTYSLQPLVLCWLQGEGDIGLNWSNFQVSANPHYREQLYSLFRKWQTLWPELPVLVGTLLPNLYELPHQGGHIVKRAHYEVEKYVNHSYTVDLSVLSQDYEKNSYFQLQLKNGSYQPLHYSANGQRKIADFFFQKYKSLNLK